MNHLDKIATGIALAQQTIPNGDITTHCPTRATTSPWTGTCGT